MQRAMSVVRGTGLSQKAATPLQSLDSVWSRQDTTSTQARFPGLTTLTTTASLFTVFLSAGKRTGQHCSLLDPTRPKVPPHSGFPKRL